MQLDYVRNRRYPGSPLLINLLTHTRRTLVQFDNAGSAVRLCASLSFRLAADRLDSPSDLSD